MKKKPQRSLCGLMILIMLLACAGLSHAEDTVTKPGKITMLTATFMDTGKGVKEFAEEYKRLTGIELEITQPPYSSYYDVLSTRFASGEVPDVIEIVDELQYYVDYATKGGLADITDLVEKSQILAKADQAIVASIRVNGRLYGFPLVRGGGTATMIRKDWLDRLNLAAPATYEELLNVMDAFTNKDPDGNGLNDTIGYTGVLIANGKLSNLYLRDFYWDACPDFHFVNGKWVDGFAQTNYGEALLRLKDAYEKGIIDQELFTNKTSVARDKITSGNAGIICYWSNYWLGRLEDGIIKTSNPDAKLIVIDPIQESHYLNDVPVTLAITSKCKNVEGVFKYLIEYMHDGKEGQNLFCYGAQGVHWDYDEKGVAHALPVLNNPASTFDKVYFSADLTVAPFTDGELVAMDPRTKTASETLFNSDYEQNLVFPYSESYSIYGSDLGMLRQEIASKIILGEITLEEGMARYANEAAELHVNDILAEFNTGT